jgi:hypothetical protein
MTSPTGFKLKELVRKFAFMSRADVLLMTIPVMVLLRKGIATNDPRGISRIEKYDNVSRGMPFWRGIISRICMV